MIRRTLVLTLVLALLAPAAAIAQTQQQQPGGPFGPLPPAEPEPAPPPPDQDDPLGDDVGTTTLYVIAGALLIAFIAVGVFISRDARRALPKAARGDTKRLREQGPHRHERQAKAKARARTKAQRAARRRNR
jgi:hypothetical protein